MSKRLYGVVTALALLLVMVSPSFAQVSEPTPRPINPNANIQSPPPIYLLSGEFTVRGTANVPNMLSYFLEFRPIDDFTLAPIEEDGPWFPATLPTTQPVENDVLGVWDTTLAEDGAYEMRLTINVRRSQPVFYVVSPLRIENNRPIGLETTALPSALPTFTARPLVTIAPTVDPTPRGTVTSATANVRSGDSLAYPVIAQLRSGSIVTLLALSSRGSGWYQVRIPSGQVGWMSFSVITVSGDINRLPLVAPPPPPPTATPVPTATTAPLPNLTAGLLQVIPNIPVCGQPFTVTIDVTNTSNLPTLVGATVTAEDTRASDNTLLATGTGSVPALAPNQTFRVTITTTVTTFFNEAHRLNVRVDAGNQISETNEQDNLRSFDYVLQAGNCTSGQVTPVGAANLVAGNIRFEPAQPVCNQPFTVFFDVANLGTTSTGVGGSITIRDTRAADGSVQGEGSSTFGTIGSGQTVTLSVPFSISTWFNETHRVVAVIDGLNQVPESNETDNTRTIDYVLAQGSCS